MGAADNLGVQFMPRHEVEKMADPNVPLAAVAKEDEAYLNGIYEGRGAWEGRGYKEHGMINPIEVTNGVVSEGHHRLVLAQRRGDEKVPVVFK